VDDFVLPLQMRLASGCEIIYDTSIVANEETPAEMGSEFRRRSRIGAGGFQSIGVLWRLLSPLQGWVAFSFASHKLLRWCVPFLLLGAVLSNLFLIGNGLYQAALSAQGLFYTAAVLGAMSTGAGLPARLLRVASLFTGMNIALLAGFWRWATGVQSGAWERTMRTTSEPSTIRVVHVVISLQIGGLEMVVANLANYAGRRFKLHVICLESIGPIATRLGNPDVNIECIGTPATSTSRSVRMLRRRLKYLRPDVVHTHNEKAHIHATLATLGWSRRPVLIHTRHGRSRAAGTAATLANRLAIRRSSYLVSVSDDASHIAESEGARPEQLRVIRNGIDVSAFDASGYDERFSRGRAVAVARLSPVKDIATMLRAVRAVVDRRPDFHLDVVGDGPSRGTLEALRCELGLERHVTFHGASDNVRGFLENAAVFVQTSITEGISLTLLEAMSAGLPVVATSVGGTPEVVEDGVSGLLVPSGEPSAVADALVSLMTDRSTALFMSRAARERVERLFDVRQMTSSYEALYEGGAMAATSDATGATAMHGRGVISR
jgi:glycosyltransferase involved in cell wall biosynthesis